MAAKLGVNLDAQVKWAAILTVTGLLLLGLGAIVPVPTGGGLNAVAAGLAVLCGFTALLLGIILYVLGMRV